MKNFIFFIGILTVLIVIGGIFISSTKQESSNQSQEALVPPTNHEYYWSETCPHCANVAEFMESWEGKDKFQMQKFEVNQSRDNALKFYQRGIYCQISRDNLGVPLLVTPGGECFSGDEPIIQYLKDLDL